MSWSPLGASHAVPVLGFLLAGAAAAQTSPGLEALKKIALEGDTTAMVGVGLAYAQGKLAPRDMAEAMRWYQMAAEKGDPDGMSRLGMALLQAGKTHEPEGLTWIRKAAEAGIPESQAALGIEYVLGRLQPQDVALGYGWMVVGVQGGAKGMEAPLVKLEMKLRARPELQAKATEAANRMLKDRGRPATWRPLHDQAEAGEAAAEYALGYTHFLSGSRGTGPDLAQAYVWLALAKAHGSKDAEPLLPHVETLLKGSRTEGPGALARAQAEVQRRLAPAPASSQN